MFKILAFENYFMGENDGKIKYLLTLFPHFCWFADALAHLSYLERDLHTFDPRSLKIISTSNIGPNC